MTAAGDVGPRRWPQVPIRLREVAVHLVNLPLTRRFRTAHGTTTPLHVGRTTIVVQTDIRDDAGKRVALVTQTQAVITRPA